jgi:hypothetical protein
MLYWLPLIDPEPEIVPFSSIVPRMVKFAGLWKISVI